MGVKIILKDKDIEEYRKKLAAMNQNELLVECAIETHLAWKLKIQNEFPCEIDPDMD